MQFIRLKAPPGCENISSNPFNLDISYGKIKSRYSDFGHAMFTTLSVIRSNHT